MQDAFAEIKNKLNIKEVIEHYISNKFKRDKINCPFHNDKMHHYQLNPKPIPLGVSVVVQVEMQ